MNTETIVHPRLHHLGITTSNIDAMVNWYRLVVGMDLVHRTDSATAGTDEAAVMKSAWVTNDEANHRLAFVQVPGLSEDPDKARHHRVQHFAFAYNTLDELLGKPIGHFVDPEQLLQARQAGASPLGAEQARLARRVRTGPAV
ncbi:catechol 2,3-dioxygenase-like lactoylglutathione lyase family enzyme [Nonomuraea thailandensis]|uniref:Catechol 2,3-dioxygenase-like lactoylglutathione lyase family enzyme n=1 Tax=Nonomuraea thailandensis TaxID=1188745 RepID=A0A9X2K553_9ACTN|nr:VOC family protein [Nonomuraea thailandensis]MCP2360025.1 catechol 2,3-dioxygenase-like lactoylglutathione lyase family enzyme [Nonomuraea thailandensis]